MTVEIKVTYEAAHVIQRWLLAKENHMKAIAESNVENCDLYVRALVEAGLCRTLRMDITLAMTSAAENDSEMVTLPID